MSLLPNYLQEQAWSYQYQKIRAKALRKTAIRRLQFYGVAKELQEYEGHEAIISGPYETGKTIATLQKIHIVLYDNPNVQALAVRETYKSLLGSAVVTFENKILPYPPEHELCPIIRYGGKKPEWYDYPSGSRLLLGGLDTPDKFLSGEFDIIYVNQAEEIELNSWELLTGRATGRAGNLPNPQILGDCNPSYPNHWILKRENIKLFHSKHEDNPVLFNPDTGEITEQGKLTLSRLDNLTGLRYKRGRLGLWVQAEGVIYDNFTLDGNVTELAEYKPGKAVRWGVDDGYVHGEGPGTASYHPRVFLFGQRNELGGIDIFNEYVATQELPEISLNNVLAMSYPIPELAAVDSSASQLRARIGQRGIMNGGATHKVNEGIKYVRELVCDGQGIRALRIHPRCKNSISEMQSYRYANSSKGIAAGEPAPLKVDDHCLDALRYMVWSWR